MILHAGHPVHSVSSSVLPTRASWRMPSCTESLRPRSRAGVDRTAMASRSVRVSAPDRDESPTTIVAQSGEDAETRRTGPSRESHADADGAPEEPTGAGRRGTEESTGGTLRCRSHAPSSSMEATHAATITKRCGQASDVARLDLSANGVSDRQDWGIERNLDGPRRASMRRGGSGYVTRRMPRDGADH
jgi:hypothetical protein